MIKRFLILVLFVGMLIQATAQEKVTIYNAKADAAKDLEKAVKLAKEQNKHVLIQVGGNWCPWCIKLHGFFNSQKQVDSVLKADYVFLLVNYSKENPNFEMMKKLEWPNRFGFPVLVVLDANGKRIHTQNSAYLEEGKGYSKEKVIEFLLSWNRKALDTETYKDLKPKK